jgi:hypothetical protein
VGNEMRSTDLIDYQEGRREISDFKKGEEMNSEVSLDQQGVLTEEDQTMYSDHWGN